MINYHFSNKPWSSDKKVEMKNKSVNAFYTAELLALVNSMSVLSQFELVMTIISGAFLLLHVVSARLLSKKNPYGGKLFWFLKF